MAQKKEQGRHWGISIAGAAQNRLENTLTVLGQQAGNLASAESRLSDADIARDMTMFARAQILGQSATAMLAQANIFPTLLLRLVRT